MHFLKALHTLGMPSTCSHMTASRSAQSIAPVGHADVSLGNLGPRHDDGSGVYEW